MIKTIFECDACKKEVERFVVFDASDTTIKSKPIFCRDCAVNDEIPAWLDSHLANGSNAVIITAGVVKVGR